MLALAVAPLLANDNGLAKSPPRGWRSWNLYGTNFNQSMIESIMDGMVRKHRKVNGIPMSLCDLGYCDVGIDDGWQACGQYGPGKALKYHNEDGRPVVDTRKFPDLKAMTDHAHKRGLTAGWYGNNCICPEQATHAKQFYDGDVKALRAYGFDSWKLDACGSQLDMQLYDDLIKETPATSGRTPIMVENCHWGQVVPFQPTATWCPFHMYRVGGDVRAKYASVMKHLQDIDSYAQQNLSRPGCWAYLDMLVVGIKQSGPHPEDPGLSAVETTTHFAAWAILSSPLILSLDVNDENVMDAVWDVVSNKEALEVNHAYVGHSGAVFKRSTEQVALGSINPPPEPVIVPAYAYYYKPMEPGGAKTAVLLINHADVAADLTLNFADIPGVTCTQCHVRDIWAKKGLGNLVNSYEAKAVASHDSRFLLITPAHGRPKISQSNRAMIA